MSFDLAVFDPATAPRSNSEFLAWYKHQTDWHASISYSDLSITSAGLRHWCKLMSESFPPINRPAASEVVDDPKLADYCIGKSVVYVGFRWSEAEEAYLKARAAAEIAGVGFFDVSGGSEEIWFPPHPKRARKEGIFARLLAKIRK